MPGQGRRVVGRHQGADVEEITLVSDAGVEIAILTYGALVRDWRVPVGDEIRTVVLGFDRFEDYPLHSPHFGALAGRVANRIGGAQFALDGDTYRLPANLGPHHLHGGPQGIGNRVWRIAGHDAASVTLTLDSPDGDMGYPGALDMAVTYRLDGHRLDIAIEARTDAPTPVNIVQHNYFNLSGGSDVRDHTLWLAANAYTELDAQQIPTGAILPVAKTALDFRRPKRLRDDAGGGLALDHNLVLDTRRTWDDPVAVLDAPDKSLTLRLFTDQPGVQVYSAQGLALKVPGLKGARYGAFAGICLEDQMFPDAVNHPHFPDTIVTPDAPYRHRCAIEIK